MVASYRLASARCFISLGAHTILPIKLLKVEGEGQPHRKLSVQLIKKRLGCVDGHEWPHAFHRRRLILKEMIMTHRFWNNSAAAAALVLMSLSGAARADGHQCSNSKLRGTYSFGVHGSLVGVIAGGVLYPYSSPQLIDGVAVQTFDGKGTFTRKDFLMNTGLPRPGATNTAGFAEGETGTYQVNADCTGTMHIVFPGAPAAGAILDIQLVVGDDGQLVRGVVSKEQVPGSMPSANGMTCGAPCFIGPQISIEGTKVDTDHGR